MKWTNVKDRLPDPKDMSNVTVLVCQKSKLTNRIYVSCVARWNGREWISKGETLIKVTHWMPLPEPPKEG